MKNLFHFIIWFNLMAFISLPVVWYINSFFGLRIDIAEPLMLLAGSVFIILAALSTEFFEFVYFYLEFPFKIFSKIEKHIQKRKLKILKTKDYVKIKE